MPRFDAARRRRFGARPEVALSKKSARQRRQAALRQRRVLFEPLEQRTLLATLTWVGDVDANWNTNSAGNTNWDTNTLPGDGDTLLFNGGGANFTQTNDTTVGNSYTLQFTAGGYTISGNSIALDNSGTDISSTTGSNTLNTPFTMPVEITIDTQGASTIVTGTTAIMSGAGGLRKQGTGTLNLGAVSTYAGNNIIEAGLAICSNTTSGGGGFGIFNSAVTKIQVLSGATVDMNGSARGAAGAVDFFYGLTIAGSGSAGQGAFVNNGLNSGTGFRSAAFIALSANATIGGTGSIYMLNGGHNPDQLTLNGFTLTKIGANTFFLDNTTVTAGTIQVSAGGLSQINGSSNMAAANLILDNTPGVTFTLSTQSMTVGSLSGGGALGGNIVLGANTLTVNQTATTTYNGVISGAGHATNGAVIKTGSGSLTLGGANTYTGSTTLSQGTLRTTTGAGFGTSTVTLGDANTLANNIQLGLVANITNPIVVSASGTGTVTLLGEAQFSAHSGTLTLNRTAILQIPSTGTGSDWWYAWNGVVSGAGGVIIKGGSGGTSGADGGNRVILGNTNTYTGGTVIESGKLQTSVSGAMSTGTVTFGNAATGTAVTQLRVGANTPNNISISAAAPLSPSAIGTYIATPLFTGTLDISHPLSITGGSDRLTWTGGTAVWSGTADVTILANRVTHDTVANTWTGNLIINAGGTFQPGNANTLSPSTTVTANGTLQLNNVSTSINALNGAATGIVQNIISGNTLTIGATNGSGTFAGIMRNNSGTLTIVKAGTGTQTLTGANIYTGATTISQGSLILGDGGATGSLATATVTLGDVNTGANPVAFLVNRSDASTHANPIVVSANGTGTATIGSTGTTAGAFGTIFSGTVTLNRATTMQGTDPDRTTFSGIISGNVGTLTVTGGARTTWEASNTFVGNVVVTTAGTTLQIGPAGDQIPNASNVDLGAGTFLRLNNDGEAINSLTGSGTIDNIVGANTLTIGSNNGGGTFAGTLQNGSGALSLIKVGSGTQILTGAVGAFTGSVAINGGTLTLNRAGAAFDGGYFPSTTTLTVNTGAILNVANSWNIGSANNVQILGGTLNFTSGAANDSLNYMNNLTLNGGTVMGNPFRVGNSSNGTFLVTGSTASTISAGLLLVNDVDVTGVRTLTVNVADTVAGAATDLTMSGNIRDLGQNGTSPLRQGTQFIKIGNGTLALPSANTYTGITTVSAGVLDISNGSALGTGPAVIVGGGTIDLRNNITVPNALTLNQSLANGTLRNAAGDNIWSGPITIPTTSQSIINVAAGTLAVSGALISNGYGNKTGPGTLILSGVNGGGGWMDVSAGLVSLRSNTAAVGTYFHVNNPAAILELSGGVSIPAGETVYVSGVPANLIPTFRGVNGANTFGGTLILHNTVGNRNIGADAGSSLTLTGAINGTDRNFIKVGGGTVTIAGTGNYSGTTNVAEGTLVLQNGNAILNTGGAVSVALGATLELLSNETISSFSGAGDGVGTNDSTLVLGGNTLTTTGSAAIANVTTAAGAGIVAGTSITDADDDNNITGTNIYLQATAGIGTAVDPIETAVGAIQLNNTTSGAVNIANSNAAILLTVSDLRSLGYAARNLGGLLSVTTVGPLTIATTVTAAAALTLSAGDTAASGDNLTVNSPAMIQSTGSTVTLNGGDTVTVPTLSFIAAAGTVTINVDAGSADTTTGGVVTLTADIDAPLAVINGGTDAVGDSFTVRPDQDTGDILTPIQVNGLAPTATMTGDTLTLVLTGLGIPTLTLTPGDGNGAFSFGASAASLVYNSIENIVTSPALPYHLVVDMQYLGFANAVADTILAQISPSGVDLLLAVNAAPLFTGTKNSIQSLTIIGSSDDETLTIQETTGGLPLFQGGAPVVNNTGIGGGTSAGSQLNASADLTLETILPGQAPWDGADVSFHFAAGGGTDTLQLNLTSANNAGYFSDTIGAGNSGNLLTAPGTFPALGAPTMLMSFDNIEPVTFSGAGGTLLTDATGTPALSTITLTDIGTQTQLVADAGLPTTTLSGFAGLAVVSGNGAESINLLSVDAAILTAVQIIAGNTSDLLGLAGGDTAADTLRVQSLPATTTATLQGSGGSDLFQLYNTLNTVDLILGPVIIDGSDGSLANNTDTLTIIDTGDTTADDVLIAPVNVLTSQDYSIDGITTAASSDVVFRNIDVLNYTATTGNDRIDGRFANTVPSHDLSTVNLSGWTGADQFLLFTSDQIGGTGPNVTPTGVTSGLAMINLYGDALGNPNAGDGIDTFGENPPLLVGTGAANVGQVVTSAIRGIRPSVTTGILIDGGLPLSLTAPQGDLVGDVLNLDISAISNAAPVIVSSNSPGTLAVAGVQPINWTEIEDMNLVDQAKLTNVQMGDLFGRATPGNDLVQFMNGSSNANPNGVRMRVNNTVGDYRASNKTVMYTGGANDFITQANVNLPAEFYGEGGDDYLSGALGNDWLSGGLGHDSINGSGGDNIIWGDNAPTLPSDPTPQDDAVGGNDSLSGLGGNDVFYGGGGDDQVSAGGGNDYAYGGQGNDSLDGSGGDDRLYGGLGNDILAGASGHDLLSGGGNDDKLYGGDGNDVIIGGSGADLIDGGSGADLLITGSLPNETSSWTSVASTTTYNPTTYFNPAASDAALLTLLAQWSLSNDNSSALGIQHDGANDDVFGSTGDDDFCWESADTLDSPPFFQLPDFNATGMGSDERFGPQ